MRRLTVPKRSIAAPRLVGRYDAISRRILDASLQPLPDVVMPICNGPSECVESSVKVQRFGASTTLTGIRLRLQSVEIWVPVTEDQPRDIYSLKPCILRALFPPEVTKTASTTLSTSSLPKFVR